MLAVPERVLALLKLKAEISMALVFDISSGTQEQN